MARHRNPEDSEDDLPPVAISRHSLSETIHLFGYLWPYRVKFALALLCLLGGSLASLGFPYLAGNLVNAALDHLLGKETLRWDQNVNHVALALVGILALQAVFAFLRSIWFIEVGERSLVDLRRDTYTRMVRLPMAFHSQRRVGELASRLSADLTQVRDTIVDSIPHFLRQSVLLVGGITLIAVTSLHLTGVMLISLPVLTVIAVLFGRAIRRLAREAQDRLADSNVVVEETLQNIASVKSFANEPFEQARYSTALDAYLRIALRVAWFDGAFVAFIVFALFGAMVLVLWYGTVLVQAEQITVGELTSFLLYTVYVAGAFGSFAELYSQIQRTLGASQRVREILRETPEVGEGGATAPRLRGEVRFEEVEFRYPSRKEVAVLQGVTLEARAGQRIALVGPSGAGKSTIVSLLLRFYEPESGRILIDDRDARAYDLHALRMQMALVPQDVILFGGTIAENIGYGRPGASAEEIEKAARLANAHDFIVTFPEGYQTRVGERGVQLSGGQRQRVAIARALLRDPAILILDEATSSLDSASERLVLQAMDRLMEGRTSLVIAHRLSTVRGADRIYVVKEGTIVEAGTHAELMAQPEGIYRTFSQLQLEGHKPENGSTLREEGAWLAGQPE